MGKIQRLSPQLINAIAAGEVVERPASVVKELMENALDAKSSTIIVKILNGGSNLIEVIDDGIGIEKDDANMIIEQHATSKISKYEDLNEIYTLGFRGEALASIAAVSGQVEITSKTEDGNAFVLKTVDSKPTVKKHHLTSHGTDVKVINLFAPVPARKKFLKSESTEFRHIVDMFNAVAFPHLKVRFELYHNDKKIAVLSKTHDAKTRIFELFGQEIAKNLLVNETEVNGIKLKIFTGNSKVAKTVTKYQYTYLNNRFVKSSVIHAAVSKAYHGFMHRDLKPVYFIFIVIDPRLMDVNVHPRKLEVKFQDEQSIFIAVEKAVRNALNQENQNLLSSISSSNNEFPAYKTNTTFPKSYTPRAALVRDALNFTQELYTPNTSTNDTLQLEDSNFHDVGITQANTLESKNFWQLLNTYICYEEADSLVILDQHAAAEKILFEKLLANLNNMPTKPLLIPALYNASSDAEKLILIEQADTLNGLGFIIEDFGGKTIQVQEIPEYANIRDFEKLFEDFAKDASELGISTSNEVLHEHNITKNTYLKLATIACHGSIRAGQPLLEAEMRNIVEEVINLKGSLNCPHGRPIVSKISKAEIEKIFQRNL